ncbi:hypothetical protein MSAN_00362200 [Mycena sanguinolenta]|uniref:DUF427 domain-containing protein n=1 Tax=Mycena sanguinolenta TaxID=230812 RepID=A0A8H6ZCA7_9AGAR|nr:hypothetical protein MSAN_00362200 [Mycena sanguinolenta]
MVPPPTEAHVEDCPKRIRVLFGGEFVVDTKKATLVWEHRFYPTYFFPHSELSPEYLQPVSEHPTDGDIYDLIIASKKAAGAVTKYTNSSHTHLNEWIATQTPGLKKTSKSTYTRKILTRHIRVEVEGVEVANTRSPKLLFETSLPVRSYLPKTDCRLDLLVPSDLKTSCPYKASLTRPGDAQYFHVQVSPDKLVENVVWWYKTPTLECSAISGLVAFYDERVDVFVDGEKQARPQTHFWRNSELHSKPVVE